MKSKAKPLFGSKWPAKVDPSKRVAVVVTDVAAPSRMGTDLKPKRGKFDNTVAAKVATTMYTGDLVKGIAVMHKSCLQPVFSQQEAEESAKMRRG